MLYDVFQIRSWFVSGLSYLSLLNPSVCLRFDACWSQCEDIVLRGVSLF